MHVLLNSIDRVKDFVDVASKLDSDVFLKIGRYTVDGKSIMGVFSLNLSDLLELEVVEHEDGDTAKLCEELAEKNIIVEE